VTSGTEPANPTAAVLVIGDEILSGRTRDTNSGTIAAFLTDLGIDLREVRVVPDEHDRIVAAIDALRRSHTYLFTTGGIGPTHDDITADAVGAAFEVPVDHDPRAVALLAAHYARPEDLTEARLRMARLPAGADLIANPLTKAPGFRIGNVFVMAGVPKIMELMLHSLTPLLRPGVRIHSRTVDCPVGEGIIAADLAAIAAGHPDVTIGSYPTMGPQGFSTRLVVRSRDEAALAAAEADVRAMVERATSPSQRPPGSPHY
jgi:molybdenum cofactor synthesis domain-containing protein